MARAAYCWQAPWAYIDEPLRDRLVAGIERTFGCQYSLDFLDEQFLRVQRGAPSYWLCSEQELASFINSRHLELQGHFGINDTIGTTYIQQAPLSMSRDQHIFLSWIEQISAEGGYPRVTSTKLARIKLLERADDRKTFPHFRALPAAVRLRIHDLTMLPRAANDGRDAVPQPPITMVSRQLRLETIPLFYQNQKITIRLHHHGPNEHQRTGGLTLDQEIVRYLTSQVGANLMLIRRLAVSATLPLGKKGEKQRTCKECVCFVRCDIDLDARDGVERQLIVDVASKDQTRGHDDNGLNGAVQRVLRTIAGRGAGRIRRDDFFTLSRVVEEAMFFGARPIALQCCDACVEVRLEAK